MAASLLDSQVAIVTGAGGGIGRAIALALAEAGADVVVADIIPERCETVAAEIAALGRAALAVTTDVMSVDQVQAMVGAAERRFGRIDILINNAGGTAARPFLEQSERSWRRHIDLNLVSVLAATAAAVPVMIAGGRGGAVLNISSIEASRAAPDYAVYAACKAGMESFTRTMALELADHGIRVNAIAPDITITPGIRGNSTGPVDPARWIEPPAEVLDATRRRIPLGREGIDTECGQAALYLVSAMSSYVTGVVLPVDGGCRAAAGWTRRRSSGLWSLTDI